MSPYYYNMLMRATVGSFFSQISVYYYFMLSFSGSAEIKSSQNIYFLLKDPNRSVNQVIRRLVKIDE